MTIAAALALLLGQAVPFVPTPRGSPGAWVTSDDYPTEALRAEQSGTVGFTIDVDAAGTITNCWITASSGSPALDEATCRLITSRARFNAARDERGRNVAGQFRNRIVWQIPEGEPYLMNSWSQTVRAVISETGELESCDFTVKGEPPLELCRLLEIAPPGFRIIFRSTTGPASVAVTHQVSYSLDGAQFEADYLAPGLRLTNLNLASFEIDAEGVPGNCRIVKREGVSNSSDLCADVLKARFAPPAEPAAAGAPPRQGTFLIATSVKEAPAAAPRR